MSVVVMLSLTATGTPARGETGAALGHRAVDRLGRRQGALGVDVQERVHAVGPSTASMRSRWARVTSTDETSPAWMRRASSPASGDQLVVPRRCAPLSSSPRIRGTRKRPSSAAGAPGQRGLAGQRGLRGVGAEHVRLRHHLRRRRDVVRDVAHRRDRVHDRVDLARERVQLVVGHREAGQAGEVGDVVAGDVGHVPPGSCTMVGSGSARRRVRGRLPGRRPSSVASPARETPSLGPRRPGPRRGLPGGGV